MRARVLSVLLGGILAACAVGPDYAGPPSVEPSAEAAFLHADMAPTSSDAPVALWWRQLDDSLLDQLIVAAFDNNRDLATATASLRAARAVLRERRQDFLPAGDVNATYQRQRVSEQLVGVPTGIGDFDRESDFFDVGFDAAWEADVFGRLSRRLQVARAEAEATQASRDDLLVSLAAETASAYIALRGAQVRLAVAERNAENQRGSFELTEVLLRGGRGTGLDVARARSQFETTLATIPPLRAQVHVSIQRLGVLTGLGAAALNDRLVVPAPLPDLPDIVAVGDPADLLRRRPDIRAAERELAAATAQIGVATADLFPTVSLIGGASFQATDADALFQSSTFAFSIGPQIVWDLINWTRIKARIAQADALADASAAFYEQTVLLALEETENALARYGNEIARRARLTEAEEASREAARLARLRFQNGVDDFLTVLDAERVALENEDRLVVSRIETALQLVAIYKALGGGWRATQAELASDVRE